jgi:CheY-like chemotaxis protein
MPKVLYVEDDDPLREVLASELRSAGLSVVEERRASAALQSLAEHRPDLILLDIGMPDMNGYDVARQLRADPGLNATTLVALTGYGSEDDRRRSRAAGFDGHLVKPIDFDALERLLAASQPPDAVARQRSEAA